MSGRVSPDGGLKFIAEVGVRGVDVRLIRWCVEPACPYGPPSDRRTRPSSEKYKRIQHMQMNMPVNFEDYRSEREGLEDLPIDPNSNAYLVLTFLARHPGLGFKPAEIHEQVDIPKGSLNPTLGRLKERGLVEHEPPYWSAADDDRLAGIAGTLFSMQAFEDRYGTDGFDGWRETDADPRDHR